MSNAQKYLYKNRFYLIAFAISVLFYAVVAIYSVPNISADKTARRISTQLEADRIELAEIANKLQHFFEHNKPSASNSLQVEFFRSAVLNKNAISVFVFNGSGDSLILWNNNTIVFGKENICTHSHESDLVPLHNGYYLKTCRVADDFKIVLLQAVYSFFPIQNTYLNNGFDARFGSEAANFRLVSEVAEGAIPLHNLSETESIYYIIHWEGVSSFQNGIVPLLHLIALLLLLSFLYQIIASLYFVLPFQRAWKTVSLLGLIADIIIIQLIIRWIGHKALWFPEFVFRPDLFSFGQLFPSLGWLVVHVHALFFITVALFKRVVLSEKITAKYKRIYGILSALMLPVIIFFGFHFVSVIFESTNSSFATAQMQSQLIWIWVVYLCAASVVIVNLMLIFVNTVFIRNSELKLHQSLIILAILFIISYLFVFQLFEQLRLFILVAMGIALIELILNYYHKTIINSALAVVALLVIMAVFMNSILNTINQHKAEQEQVFTARQLSIDNDPLFEFQFKELRQQILNDSVIALLLGSGEGSIQDEKIYEQIRNAYLKDNFNKFTTEITFCSQLQQLIVQPENMTISCYQFFDEFVRLKGKETSTEGLFLIDDNIQGVYYLANIPLVVQNELNTITYRLFLEFYFKYIPEGIGYPELLVDEHKGFTRDFRNYSFATYRDGILVYKFGNYLYPTRIQSLTDADSGFFDKNHFRHFVSRINENKSLIVSRKTPDFSEKTAPFAHFFILLGLLSFLLIIIIAKTTDFKTFGLSFRSKLQLLVLVSVLLSFIIVGISSTYYITDIYIKKNEDFLSEKTQSILIELEHKLKNEDLSKDGMDDYLHQLLLKFSLVFFSDINMYDLSGRLMASSRPEIYDKGLLSRLMNPEAYFALRYENKLYFSQQEEIGNGTYKSSYIPFKDSQGRAVAYINLPYFARETEIRGEIASFIAAYFNLFLMLAGFSVAMALMFSRRLTQPLQMIQKKMQLIRFGKTNEKIVWKSSDELGQLVDQYNTLLDQLSESADLLARSERETAWREMARQVAHEIKNPLTPMRLSVQYLQKAWKDNDPDIDHKMRNTTQTLIQQIDTLSSIASAFSDFARMPQNKSENINLSEVIRYCITLFDHTDNIQLEFNDSTKGEAYLKADKENLSRVFVNLIKNSIQAIGTYRNDGIVKVSLKRVENEYHIDIFDNGKGMNEEDRKKVFTPNFTTKTSGMGIGLSIVHNVITSIGGRITFSSEAGKGTEFNIVLPIDDNDS